MSDASILLVDDRPENLIALEAILEPLGRPMVRANSGEEALRQLLDHEFAVILLDVQMPLMDGFETAAYIKHRERTRYIPIIFLTAISKESRHVFQGYSAGAIDYMFKPFEPTVLRAKVAAFIDLFDKTRQIERQSQMLRESEQREREHEVEQAKRLGEERYRMLAESMPQIVWMANPAGEVTYFNSRWFEYTGLDPHSDPADRAWLKAMHPDDREQVIGIWQSAQDDVGGGATWEVECRFRRHDGVYRWHVGRALRNPSGLDADVAWIGTATDIDDAKRAAQLQCVLADVGALITAGLDVRHVLPRLAERCVPDVADWCSFDMVEENGLVERVALATAANMRPVERVQLETGLSLHDGNSPPALVLAGGVPCVVPCVVPGDEDSAVATSKNAADQRRLQEIGATGVISVPLVIRDRTTGILTLALVGSDREMGEKDVVLATELAARAAGAIDTSRLYRTAEERAQAAQVIESVGDGVFLLDRDEVIRVWNPAAEAMTGLAAADVVGRTAIDAIPGWQQVRDQVPVLAEPGSASALARSVPLDVAGRDLWLSISGVGFEAGTVYAFRDLTEERAVERMKSDFVATISHELRTPLSAIYGAAETLQRTDIVVDKPVRDELLSIVSEQSRRLAGIVNDVLIASRIDSGHFEASVRSCDAAELAEEVMLAARVLLPETHQLRFVADRDLPLVAADPGQLRQVLTNLVDNAIKYSPEGGQVDVRVGHSDGWLQIIVSDEGIGIAQTEQRRIFEKFYRIDANMHMGIGGTGLGLYICRELLHGMHGRFWLESTLGAGSAFHIELPLADGNGLARSREDDVVDETVMDPAVT